LLAKIQQMIVERGRLKGSKSGAATRMGHVVSKPDTKMSTSTGPLWRERQLRDYRKANGLCFYCGEKFDTSHIEVCQKRNKPQVHALALNDLDQILSEDTLNQLAVEDSLTEELLHLSLNAITGLQSVSKSNLWSRTRLCLFCWTVGVLTPLSVHIL
jgi:5-methylcytosine-specific restriction endonuclease McrA